MPGPHCVSSVFSMTGRLNLTSSLWTLSSTLAVLACSVQLTEVSRLVMVSSWGCNNNNNWLHCIVYRDYTFIVIIHLDGVHNLFIMMHLVVAWELDSKTGVLCIRGVQVAGTFPLKWFYFNIKTKNVQRYTIIFVRSMSDKTRHIFSQNSKYGYLNSIIIIIMATATINANGRLEV